MNFFIPTLIRRIQWYTRCRRIIRCLREHRGRTRLTFTIFETLIELYNQPPANEGIFAAYFKRLTQQLNGKNSHEAEDLRRLIHRWETHPVIFRKELPRILEMAGPYGGSPLLVVKIQ